MELLGLYVLKFLFDYYDFIAVVRISASFVELYVIFETFV